jgi:hypothetical protein
VPLCGIEPAIWTERYEPSCDAGSVDRAELIRRYWEYYGLSTSASRDDRRAAKESFDAWEEVERVVLDEDLAVPLLEALAMAAPDEQALAFLGAGPIENAIRSASSVLIDRIEGAARRNERFRLALRCAWFDAAVAPDVAARLRRFGAPY